jgi:hypothetical protein
MDRTTSKEAILSDASLFQIEQTFRINNKVFAQTRNSLQAINATEVNINLVKVINLKNRSCREVFEPKFNPNCFHDCKQKSGRGDHTR